MEPREVANITGSIKLASKVAFNSRTRLIVTEEARGVVLLKWATENTNGMFCIANQSLEDLYDALTPIVEAYRAHERLEDSGLKVVNL